MIRKRMKDTCLLTTFEHKTIKYALDTKSQIEAMIEEIERNKNQTLVPRPKDKNVNDP